jgi:D-sedoheptulose 7-phosphate isomerase
MANFTLEWISTLCRVTAATIVTDMTCNPISLDGGVLTLRKEAHSRVIHKGGRFILFGNGGSLAIASHIATDFALAGWPSIALTDAVALTSHTNDFGAEANFSKQLELLRPGRDDIMIAMSCSGKSDNVIDAVNLARAAGLYTVTLTGFEPDNPLRLLGSLNFYVPAIEYGFVQLAHESILHAACDIENGWGP